MTFKGNTFLDSFWRVKIIVQIWICLNLPKQNFSSPRLIVKKPIPITLFHNVASQFILLQICISICLTLILSQNIWEIWPHVVRKWRCFRATPPHHQKQNTWWQKKKVFGGEAWGLPSVLSIHKFSNYRSAVVFWHICFAM